MFRNREIRFYTLITAGITLTVFFFCLYFSLQASLIALIGCTVLYTAGLILTVRRYCKIAALSDYLQSLSTGKPALDIRENAEGELSILKNELYRVTTALTEQADSLQKDKLELAAALSDISHQLKTPLTSQGIMIDLLDTDSLPPEKRREFLVAIRLGQKRMEWLVLSLLKMAKLDAGAVALKKEAVPLVSLVQRAAESLLILMEIKGQTLTIFDKNKTSVTCDPEWTAEAVGNILKNAVENTPDGGIISVSCTNNPLYSSIEVRDTGPGIDQTDLPHLFQRFYRGKNARADSAGIGLALSLSIMQKQGGDIEVRNENGGVFTLKFYR